MNYFIPLSIVLLFGCTGSSLQKNNHSFLIPVILQESSGDTFHLFKENFISDSWPKFITKSMFCDSLDLSENAAVATSLKYDLLYESYHGALDSFGLDGLELYADYQTSVSRSGVSFAPIANCYFPVYIVNQTPNTKLVMGKDNYVFALQEAQDADGRWHPIEQRGFDFCGNGYWGLKVHTGEFVTVLFPKYEGTYKTKMRVRFRNRDIIYVSKPYDGRVNTTQFFLDSSEDNYWKTYIKNSPDAIQNMFYGSIPFELTE